jgi:hypothetical protein
VSPRVPKNRMKIEVRCPNAAGGWSITWSADATVLAKPGVEAMWGTITNEVAELVTRRYGELKGDLPSASTTEVRDA